MTGDEAVSGSGQASNYVGSGEDPIKRTGRVVPNRRRKYNGDLN